MCTESERVSAPGEEIDDQERSSADDADPGQDVERPEIDKEDPPPDDADPGEV